MGYLADVNVLIALLHARHALSERALAWLDRQEQPGSICLCRVAQMGVLRILTNPAWLGLEAQSPAAVWDAWDFLLTDERFIRATEPVRLDSEWRLVTRDLPAGRSADTDSYFAAFARAGGYRLATFDRGFRLFRGLDAEIIE
ncbi:MAG TPA: TA system VapC family ribonuclease toxin [Thermoanaerobaculia bacterium]|nr:TA system VapC family ribonuclease toxin [Thermoanaerobaculia bacterium]